MNQPSLFVETAHGWQAPPKPSAAPPIAGSTYDPQLDGQRLGKQLQGVLELMRDGQWRTLRQIQEVVPGESTAISARLRDLTRDWAGGHKKNKRRVPGCPGLWEYQIIVSQGVKNGDK